ncbi:50S ribosomal protein L23 [Desulfocurvus vexinensis]|uniref:50S ribosomal protein L23 n=1 Tax=Desulfocurvus vexinensis TaxID=399548 RepID=UPI00048ECBC7|nr:50S ribosomal protein L23 [Desulfocurvus vexinensis]
MDYTQILIKPLISEKATTMKEVANQIAFYVHPDANKIEIRKAVEKAFGVKVEGVNVVKRRARARTRFGRTVGTMSGFKKAYVTLAEGEKIELFEGV